MTTTVLETGTEQLLVSIDGGVATITFNRPASLNALTPDMTSALGRILPVLEQNAAVGCLVLTGAGRAFCAGGDIKGLKGRSPSDDADAGAGAGSRSEASVEARISALRTSQRLLSEAIWMMPMPTIAMLPGAAAGAGLALALACDLRYGATGSIMTTGYAPIGLAGDLGGAWFLTRLVGTGRARELFFFSERLDAAKAYDLGLLNAVFPPERLEEETIDRARKLAAGPGTAFKSMKDNLRRAVREDLAEYLQAEAANQVLCQMSDEHRELMSARFGA